MLYPQYVYYYLPENTTCTDLFSDMVSISYKKLFSIVTAVLEKSPFYFLWGDSSEGPQSLDVECSHSLVINLWQMNC